MLKPKPLHYRFVYETTRLLMETLGRLLFRTRVIGRQNWPSQGGGLVCSNHQSCIDPAFIGVASPRALNYVARETLFKIPLFRTFIRMLNAFPIDREGVGLAGLKHTLRLIRGGELVLIFPEGTRTSDGKLQNLQPGFIAVARRGKAPLIPVALDGAFQAWPRHHKLPRLARVAIAIGEPISQSQIEALSDDALLAEVSLRINRCLEQAHEARTR